MTTIDLQKLLYSAVIILVIHLISTLLKHLAKKTQQKFNIRKSRYFAVRRLLTVSAIVFSLLTLVLIWNVDVKHAWVSLTGILAMVSIAFFAVWSLIGNILAGVLIYFTSPFKIDDHIEIMPDEIRGTVLAINSFYTVLIDDEENYINIPNSLLFQKYIRVGASHKSGIHKPVPQPSNED